MKNQDTEKKVKWSQRNKEDVLKHWQANREMGKRKYILKFGVLSWGLSTFIIYWIIMLLLNVITKSGATFNLYQVIFTLLFFIVFGLLYGLILWHRNEKIFKEKYPYGRK